MIITDLVKNVVGALDIVSLTGIKDQGPHPIHGSKNGNNLAIKPLENLWYCFRHQAGGGPLQWVAIQDFNVSCEKATDYVKDNFTAVLKKACEITGIEYVPNRQSAAIHDAVHIDEYEFNEIPLKDATNKQTVCPAVTWTDFKTKRYPQKLATHRARARVTGTADLKQKPVIVVDIDIKDNEKIDLDNVMDLLDIPNTYTVQSPSGGYHLYYLIPRQKNYDAIPGNKAIVLDTVVTNKYPQLSSIKEIDIRGQGGIIYAPPTEWTEGEVIGKYKPLNYDYLTIITKKKLDNLLQFFQQSNTTCDHSVSEVREDLINYLDNKTPPHYMVQKLKKLYYYNNGAFHVDEDDDWLKLISRKYVDKRYRCCSTNFLSANIDKAISIHVERILPYKKTGNDFVKAVKSVEDYLYFNFKNCVVRIEKKTGEYNILEHSPDYMFSSQFNVRFVDDPEPGYWLDRIHESIPAEQSYFEIADRDMFLYYLAYSLIPDFSWKTCMYLHGPANTGKTTLIKNFAKVFDNVAKTNLGQLNSDTFALQNLPFADFWFSNEVDVKTLKSDMFKQIVEGAEMEFRVMRGSVDAKASFKTVITGNNLIKLTDEAIAYRIMPIKFGQRHSREDTNSIDDQLVDNLPDFISYLVLNYVPLYYINLDKLTKLQNERTYEYYKLNDDPFIDGFCKLHVQQHSDRNERFEYASQHICDMYNDWAMIHGFPKMTSRQISTKIGVMSKDNEAPFQHARKEVNITYGNNDRARGWSGIYIDYTIKNDKFKVDGLNKLSNRAKQKKLGPNREINDFFGNN